MFKLHNNETPLLLIGNNQLVGDWHCYKTQGTQQKMIT